MQMLKPVERFYSLDVLRGFAALSVVFWHWQHFFYDGTQSPALDISPLPFAHVVPFLYLKGWRAVDLFFGLSGFVFHWLYARSIAQGDMPGLRFAALRFSRLYPLHLATLLLVAALQLQSIRTTGTEFVFANGDAHHFMLNLFLASSWGFEQGMSFNGPVWSVSVEVALYAMFFVCCRLLPMRAWVLGALSLGGFVVGQIFESSLGRGIGSFFLGGCVFLAYREIVASRHLALATRWLGLITLALWAATLTLYTAGFDLAGLSNHAAVQRALVKLTVVWPVLVLFPLAILSLALYETRHGPTGKRLAWVGDLSYSSYLLHFPLQFLFFIAVRHWGLGTQVFYSGGFMLLFFAVLVVVSLLSHRYFEMPMQRILRQALSGKRQLARG